MIYLDNAATSYQKPQEVIEAVSKALQSFGSPGRGAHEPSLLAASCVAQCRHELADLLKADSPLQISFCANATQALNIAIHSAFSEALKSCKDASKIHFITSAASHNSVLRPLYLHADILGEDSTALGDSCRHTNSATSDRAKLHIIKHKEDGSLDYQELEELMSKLANTAAENPNIILVFTHASNVSGEIYSIERLSKLKQTYQCQLIVDAAQTIGLVPINLQEISLDFLCFTGHKSLLGPQGTGGLVLAKNNALPIPLFVGGSGFDSFSTSQPAQMPEILEAGTSNSHSLAGLLAAVQYTKAHFDSKLKNIQTLRFQLWDGLAKLKHLKLYGTRDADNTGLIACNIEGLEPAQLASLLFEYYGICCRAGAQCAPLMMESLKARNLGVLRLSIGPFNTQEDIQACIEAFKEIETLVETSL